MEDSKYNDGGMNLTRESGWDMTPQASKFLHDLLHGKHDTSLVRGGARPGREIARAYIIRDKRTENPAGEVLVTLDVCVEYQKTIAQRFRGTATRVNIRAYFDVEAWKEWENLSDPCEPTFELGRLCEEDQLTALTVFGVKEVHASLFFAEEMPRGSTRYEVHARHVDGDFRFFFSYAHNQPAPGKPVVPQVPIPTPVAVVSDDDDLPF